MHKRLHFLSGLLFLTTISLAQEVPGAVEKKKKGCSCAFSSVFNLGLLEGERGAQLQLQTIQGIRYRKWFAGIGAGMDYYHLRSIPLFIDLRHELLNKKHSPFIYADGGYHFAWATRRDKAGYSDIKYDGGLYYDVGLGYRLALGKANTGFLLSAGYSFKYLREERITPVCINWVCQDEASEWFRYKLNRLSLKLGLRI